MLKNFVLRKVHKNLEDGSGSKNREREKNCTAILRHSLLSGLMTFDKSKNAYAFFSCFGSEDPQHMANFYITESIINSL
jgi:hypothetical protein